MTLTHNQYEGIISAIVKNHKELNAQKLITEAANEDLLAVKSAHKQLEVKYDQLKRSEKMMTSLQSKEYEE